MLARGHHSQKRLALTQEAAVSVTVDGQRHQARLGETVLTALRIEPGFVRRSEFSGERRAGFCLMSACQDCWLWHDDGRRLRACTSRVEDGMRLLTSPQEGL
jgi:predicted molibdopterin-dependent oxidoreductase YjgC